MHWVIFSAAIASILVWPLPASACVAAPRDFVTHHAELIRRSPRIALARAERAENFDEKGENLPPYRVHFYRVHFATLEVLKGRVDPRFTLVFTGEHPTNYRDGDRADFQGHEDRGVWEEQLTRQINGPDCEMHPEFEAGATYLVFSDPPYHWRAFERIDRQDDRWLRAVRAVVAVPSTPSGLSQSLADYLAEQRAVFVGEIARCLVNDPELYPYPNEVKVREVLFGSWRISSVLISGSGLLIKCEPGLLVIAIVHRFGTISGTSDRKPPGRLLPLVDGAGAPTKTLNDSLRVNFNQGDSEALVTTDPMPSLTRLREMAASLRR